MRIAHVTATFPPHHTGTGTVCYHNALGLARLGHEVTVYTARYPGPSGEEDDPPGVTVRRLPALFRVGNAPFLPGLLGLRDYDIIHLHHPFIFGSEMVWAVSRLRGIPYVLTHHNDLIGDGLRRYLFDGYSALWARRVFRGASKFAVVSKDHAAHCRLSPLFRERWDDVVEIPNGVDTNLFRPDLDGSPVRRRHGLSEAAKVILFVGALDQAHHYRRVDLLLQAMASLEGEDVKLLVAGDGDTRSHYEAIAAELGLAERAVFLGGIDHSALPRIYAAADLVVLPSQLQESFGLVLIEAMACGKPVVASNLPGVRSVVSDGRDGLLVRPGDVDELVAKLQMLLDNHTRRREMGEQGRKKVEQRYSWPQVVVQLEAICVKMVRDEDHQGRRAHVGHGRVTNTMESPRDRTERGLDELGRHT